MDKELEKRLAEFEEEMKKSVNMKSAMWAGIYTTSFAIISSLAIGVYCTPFAMVKPVIFITKAILWIITM